MSEKTQEDPEKELAQIIKNICFQLDEMKDDLEIIVHRLLAKINAENYYQGFHNYLDGIRREMDYLLGDLDDDEYTNE